jgi:transposase
MDKPYCEDLWKRVVATVVTGESSCNEAARKFGIAITTAIGWLQW